MEGIDSLSSSQKELLMDEVKQQIAIANANELLSVTYKINFTKNNFIKR